MDMTDEEVFLCRARSWATKQTLGFGLQGAVAEDCIQSFVVKWLLKPLVPPVWTWPPARCQALLKRSAYNHVINFVTDNERQINYEGEQLDESMDTGALLLGGRSKRDTLPELIVEQFHFWKQIETALQSLAPAHRNILTSYYMDNASIADIAFDTGRSTHAIEQCLTKARKRLRVALLAQGNTEEELRECGALLCNKSPRTVGKSHFVEDSPEYFDHFA